MNQTAVILEPPQDLNVHFSMRALFLAGSIELGVAEHWQSEVLEALSEREVLILNPRRKNWDNAIELSANEPTFREQVEWELRALERADRIAMYFSPETKSPISLLELGLFARSGKLIVCCPEGFWRKGNVDIVCERYGVEVVGSLAELITRLQNELE